MKRKVDHKEEEIETLVKAPRLESDPPQPKTDLIVSIYSRHIEDMIKGAKDHEF